MKQVCFIIPMKGELPWLENCLISIKNQIYGNISYIFIDDEIEKPRIAKEMIHNYLGNAARLVKNRGTGISAALNTGIDSCDSDYVARMDTDDICAPDRIQKQVDLLETRTGELVACGTQVRFLGANNRTFGKSVLPTEPEEIDARITNSVCFFHPTLLFRREVLEQYRYRSDFDGAEDIDLMNRITARHRVANLREPLLKYRLYMTQGSFIGRGKKLALQELAFRTGAALRVFGKDPLEDEPDLLRKFVEWRMGETDYVDTRIALTELRYAYYYTRLHDYKGAVALLAKSASDFPKRLSAIGIFTRMLISGPGWKLREPTPFKMLNSQGNTGA